MATSVGASDPTQNERMPFTKSLCFLARQLGLPQFEQCGRTPCGQRLNDIVGAVAGLDGARIVAAQAANDAVIAPFEIVRAPAKGQAIGWRAAELARSSRRKRNSERWKAASTDRCRSARKRVACAAPLRPRATQTYRTSRSTDAPWNRPDRVQRRSSPVQGSPLPCRDCEGPRDARDARCCSSAQGCCSNGEKPGLSRIASRKMATARCQLSWIEFRHEILAAQPAVVKIERNVGLACQPHQPLGRQLHVQAKSRCGG